MLFGGAICRRCSRARQGNARVFYPNDFQSNILVQTFPSNGEIVPTTSFLVQDFHKVKFPFFKGHGAGPLGCVLFPFSGAGPSRDPSNLDLIDMIRVIAEVQLSFVVACNIEGIVASHRRREVCLHSSAKVISTIGW